MKPLVASLTIMLFLIVGTAAYYNSYTVSVLGGIGILLQCATIPVWVYLFTWRTG